MQVRIEGIVLAAGGSSRFGSCKQLALVAGEPLLVRTVRSLLQAKIQSLTIVLGANATQIKETLQVYFAENISAAGQHGSKSLPLKIITNEQWEEGMGTTLACGIRSCSEQSAALVCLGDLPLLRTFDINLVIETYLGLAQQSWTQAALAIVCARYLGKHGHPIIFAPSYFPALKQLKGDKGARELLRAKASSIVWVDGVSQGCVTDIDTIQELQSYMK